MGEDHFHHLQPDHNYRPPSSYGYKVEALFLILFCFVFCSNSLALMQPKVNNSFLILAISLPQDTGLKTSSKKKASGRMDSDDSSRKEEEEEDETPIETTSEKTEKTEPNEGSHGEPNVGKPHVATHAGEQDGNPPVAT